MFEYFQDVYTKLIIKTADVHANLYKLNIHKDLLYPLSIIIYTCFSLDISHIFIHYVYSVPWSTFTVLIKAYTSAVHLLLLLLFIIIIQRL